MGVVYQCTLNCNANGSPITILVLAELRLGLEYAVAASMSASCVANSGLVCNKTFNFEEMWRWESWRAPERAKMRGMKSSFVDEEDVVIWLGVRG